MKNEFKIIILPSESSELYKYGIGFSSTLTYKPTFLLTKIYNKK